MLETVAVSNGRKRKLIKENWSKNVKKRKRNMGKEYISISGNRVSSRQFEPVGFCCKKKKCFEKIKVEVQKEFHSKFWSMGDYEKQNIFISNLMICKDPVTVNNKTSKSRLVLWNFYLCPYYEEKILVCKNFLYKALKIDEKRLRTVQKKIIAKKSLNDERGKGGRKKMLLTNEVKNMIKEHCYNQPHRKAHYDNSCLNYFENSELDLKTMFHLFTEYYATIKNSECPLKESTYSKYFNRNIPFTFKRPHTDMCDFCEISRINNKLETEELIQHKNNVKHYQELKKLLLTKRDLLCCEFDYAQNLVLPKIPVNEQFYKRKLWLYLFNVHIHGTTNSYMLPYLEGFAKKGANTICSFLNYCVKKEFHESRHSKIVFFSDAAGGQNRNYTVFTYMILLSIYFNVEIWHIFPIRGHSYCQCDRNFGLYAEKLKKTERIETAEKYFDIIKDARNPPFILVDNSQDILQDYEKVFQGNIQKPKGMKISEARMIKYYPTKEVKVFDSYSEDSFQTFNLNVEIDLKKLKHVSPPKVGITKSKIEDAKTLMPYLSNEGKQFFKSYLSKMKIKQTKKKGRKCSRKEDFSSDSE